MTGCTANFPVGDVILSFLQKYEMGQADFFQQVKHIMFFLHTKFQKNPDRDSKVMIKTRLCCVLIATNCPKLPVRSESRHVNFPVASVSCQKD
jgi:hypothetical protein